MKIGYDETADRYFLSDLTLSEASAIYGAVEAIGNSMTEMNNPELVFQLSDHPIEEHIKTMSNICEGILKACLIAETLKKKR